MKAVILAGGKGTRLAPYTTVLPKPLMPIGDMPILEIMIRQLKAYGLSEIILCVGYLGSLLEAYFGHGEKLGIPISYSYEQEPLGTAGPIGLVSGLDRTFFVMNGDLLTTIDFSAMLRFHFRHGQIATVGLANKTVKIDLGVVKTSADNELVDYVEKPTYQYGVSMGIYVFEPEILSYVRGAGRIDLPDLVLRLVRERRKPMAFASNCQWLDIGRLDDYSSALEVFEKERETFLPPAETLSRIETLENVR
jgi:NDP-sugar pyrophosphorylase family protein